MTHPTPLGPSAPLDCDAVDGLLARFLDEHRLDESPPDLTSTDPAPLDPATRAAVRTHVARCARCGPLVADLRALSAHAAALPTLAPPRDLWAGIADRLTDRPAATAPNDAFVVAPPAAAPVRLTVVDGAAARTRRAGPQSTPLAFTRRRLAAAAVLLVTLSSGATYLATRRPNPSPAPPLAAANSTAPNGPTAPATGAPAAPPNTPLGGGASAAPASEVAARTPAPRRIERPTGGARSQADARFASHTASPDVDANVPGAEEYDREIGVLRAAVRERRGELDPVTVAVLRRNLRIIDAAIAASRAALARDPHSPFLGDQLTRALGQKVELLRTTALLPRS